MCEVALGGVRGCSGGACMVALGGICMVSPGGHAWLHHGGTVKSTPCGAVRGCSWGACVVFSMKLPSMSG